MGPEHDEMDGVYWRAYVAAVPGIVLVADPEGTILSGTSGDPRVGPLLGRKLWEFGAGDAKTRIQEKLRAVVDARKALIYANIAVRPDGSEGYYEVCAVPVIVDGAVQRILWSASDISDRVNARSSLEASERRARALVEHGRDRVPLVDATGAITWASPGLYTALGFQPGDILGARALDFIHPDDRQAAFTAGTGSPVGSVNDATVRVRHKDGSYRVFEGTSQNLFGDPAIRAVVNNHRDVTARRALEEELQKAQRMEAMGLLAGGVAHDFNNLLAIIVGWSGLAQSRLPEGHPVRQHLFEVDEAARRGSELTRKLLAFSRKQIMKPTALDLRSVVDDFTRILQRIVGADVAIEVERSPVPLVVRADPAQLEQVLMNLCANARQAMPEGGALRIVTRASEFDAQSVEALPWARAGAFAEIAVSDTGVGIDEATRARVFEPFFTTKPEGTGLGLAMVFGIVEQHGGFIHVESAPGIGTTFRAYLPTSDDLVEELKASAPIPRAGLGGTETVLVAEDEPSLRTLIEATLSELGYRVTATCDGEDAVRAYEQRPGGFDLVVLDIVMPRLGGRDAFERIRAIDPGARVLFTTGYAPSAAPTSAASLGGRPFPLLEKPFTPSALAVAVAGALDRKPHDPS